MFRRDNRPTYQVRADLKIHLEELAKHQTRLDDAIAFSKEFDLTHRQTAQEFEMKISTCQENIKLRQELIARDKRILRWRSLTDL